ncbi:uncharacterized protein PHACADRAFT_29130 [Phanerochaete carnosa HHB-10118-sp]|uniref:Uncharacterized protein n=1 Tax=Phanerochaete carnosa (strain HHB-10118-sp) TaxID=650164 RepID=K5WB16_PHACS|nr:uncharacterized protein PHACADRAFT_29130 [Phanerochaete carnosa HHB-10118-sp]EKM56184.1 hypothetical protein PHACADRAFT_29130 [Phanerochaete carnosa HHB-10118-sp]
MSTPLDNSVNGNEMAPPLEPAVPVKDHLTAIVIIDPVSMLTMKDLQDVLYVLFDKAVEVINLIAASELLCMIMCASVAMCNLCLYKLQMQKVQVVGCHQFRDVLAACKPDTNTAHVSCVAVQLQSLCFWHTMMCSIKHDIALNGM